MKKMWGTNTEIQATGGGRWWTEHVQSQVGILKQVDCHASDCGPTQAVPKLSLSLCQSKCLGITESRTLERFMWTPWNILGKVNHTQHTSFPQEEHMVRWYHFLTKGCLRCGGLCKRTKIWHVNWSSWETFMFHNSCAVFCLRVFFFL